MVVWRGMAAVPRGRKKVTKLSRLGELLNTQKNVHFFAPRADRPGRGAKMAILGPMGYTPQMGVLAPEMY